MRLLLLYNIKMRMGGTAYYYYTNSCAIFHCQRVSAQLLCTNIDGDMPMVLMIDNNVTLSRIRENKILSDPPKLFSLFVFCCHGK